MLKQEDNERLCRVGPGTPMGMLMRRYWQPAALSVELPERDGAPIRVRLLGEDLVAFRDSNGKIGLIDAYCPHRRAPLFFGRNEECGLRCVYHGWKFDADGACVDLPSEAASSPMKAGVKITAYPAVERGGVVWAYLGPKEHMPAPPDFEWTRVPPTHCHVSKTFEDCNWLQALEGGLDTAHGSFLHNNQLGNKKLLRQRDGAPKIDVEKTDYGYYYVSTRKPQADANYVRVYQYIMPAQQMRANVMGREGGRNEVPKLDGHVWAPVDDGHCCVYNWAYAYDSSTPISDEYYEAIEKAYGRGKDDFIPGTFRLKRNLSNDYLIDRQIQKTENFTGIAGINTQDFALQEGMGRVPGMGAIADRSQEHLGTSDRAIVIMRRMLLEAIDAAAAGAPAPGADPAQHRSVRPHEAMVPVGQDWRQAFGHELAAKW
ncbi:MAG TPA: Rieske 2Fe-2S domain-containing protein [Stellaceae bacterium]|jgi:phenylpropionate dioxygenase-like ring-hydroxylating dioxygenase large terminal subunit